MARSFSAAPARGLLLTFFMVTAVAAAEDDEFAFNIFSDVAPILALFGEQFARQFMSESLTWLDHLIFAMVPLGIVAAVTGAIRVQGPHIAKAFIGRARENRALVEFELMSSTSHEVGEAFNGKGIVRVMGKTTIAEFLIFPTEYNAAETFYDKLDGAALPTGDEDKKHALCGIHNLQSSSREDQGFMRCSFYHSYSYNMLASLLKQVRGDVEQGKSEEQSKTRLRESLKALGPPNLQLNFSSDHLGQQYRYKKRIELVVTAIVAVTIQIGLLVLAATTILYQPLRDSIGFDPKVYGLPCYLAGSTLLSIGVGICSYAVERNTTEFVWTIPSNPEHSKSKDVVDQYPRLIFLQKGQTVNDQKFDAYELLAGPKRQILASARATTSVTNDGKQDEPQTTYDRLWELITVAAAATAGVGFTAQFMGLRGLTYPTSIAQILAIIVLTLLRAYIRRRMGREPAHCKTITDYELDYLAMHIVFNAEFRDYRGPLKGQRAWGASPRDICFWGIKLPTSETSQLHPVKGTVRDSSERQKEVAKPNGSPESGNTGSIAASTPTSEQLTRVRKRLGELCRWNSKATEAALILCRSIEAFMSTFFPPQQSDNPSFSWAIQTQHVSSDGWTESRTNRTTVILPIVCEKGEWNIDLEKIEAILSLWMASIEAEFERKRKRSEAAAVANSQTAAASGKSSRWRRKGGIATNRYTFYRILGEDDQDGALKRDLSWWISERFTIQGRGAADGEMGDYAEDVKTATSNKPNGQGLMVKPDFTIGFNSEANYALQAELRPRNLTENREPEEGESPEKNGERKEIGLEGEASLPILLIQHLFTNFVWTMSKSLPRNCLPFGFEDVAKEVGIEGRERFDPDYLAETWNLPKLYHTKLSELVRQIETYGMGTNTDILLCIIPAFSAVDRLPNQAMLQLIPAIGKDSAWIPIARCYNSLMAMNMRTDKPESLCLAAVIQAKDFLYFAHLPYDTVVRPPKGLRDELERLVALISRPRFKSTVSMLVPMHQLQGRRVAFRSIYQQYKENVQVADGCLGLYESTNTETAQAETESILAFSESHQKVSSWLRGSGAHMLQLTRNEAVPRDIFGWTPIHYSCVFNEGGMELSTYLLWWDDILENRQAVKLHKQLDRFRRSPVHIAASNGLGGVLEHMFNRFIRDQNEASIAVNAAGADGMTPIHWAAQSGEPQALEALTKSVLQVSTTATDIWGREPLHIAARQGSEDVVNLILKAGRWSLSTDTLGKNPVEYVLTQPSTRDQAKGPTSTADTNSNEKARRLIQDPQRLQILERFVTERPAWKDQSGRSFLHYAVEATELPTVQKLVESQKCNPAAEDSDGRTALHVALANNNVPASLYLLGLPDENLREIAQAKASLLVDACKGGCTAAIPRILELWPEADAINKGDAQYDQSALSWAIETGHNDAAELLVNHPLTDLDKPATRHYDLTPLHFAAMYENTEGMKLLLRQPSERIDIRQKDSDGRIPLRTAIWFERPQTARLLLLHPETPATDRERYLEEILMSSGTTFRGIVADLFKHMAAHDALSAKGLSEVIEGSTYLSSLEHFEKFVTILLRGNALDLAKGLYLPAVRAHSARAISELLRKGVDSTSIDEDGWSLEYYLRRFDRMELLEGLSDGLLQSQKETTYPAPKTLLRDERHDFVSVDSCTKPGHKDCVDIQDVRVAKVSERQHISIRSKECISPSSSQNYFYFEITVVRDSPSRELGLGYCRATIIDDRMPGWDSGSWAWHGDDGDLFIENDEGFPVGDPELSRPFKAGDVAGVGMDFETGQGFRTLNGQRLKLGLWGKKIQERQFHIGKLYPCVGFGAGGDDEGLQFEVNFGGSPYHPFMYKGPFRGDVEE